MAQDTEDNTKMKSKTLGPLNKKKITRAAEGKESSTEGTNSHHLGSFKKLLQIQDYTECNDG